MNHSKVVSALRVEHNLRALAALQSYKLDKSCLHKYSGWGGLRDAVYTPEIYRRLKMYLKDEEIISLKKTFKSAYMTPKPLVDFIYQVVSDLGQFERILEPCAGSGAFFEHMPQKIREKATITAVEIDTVSCRLLRTLYPDVNVYEQPFEQFDLSKNQTKFDLIVGNPPFGQMFVNDPKNSALSSFSMPHYFVARCMRLLQPNGILAMVVPRYFMDNVKKEVRSIIDQEGGSLLAAYRFPEDLFQNAKVCVDVVFLQKKSTNDKLWLGSKRIIQQARFAFMNDYFLNHPENILGKIDFIDVYGRTEITCKRTKDWRLMLPVIGSTLALQFQRKGYRSFHQFRKQLAS